MNIITTWYIDKFIKEGLNKCSCTFFAQPQILSTSELAKTCATALVRRDATALIWQLYIQLDITGYQVHLKKNNFRLKTKLMIVWSLRTWSVIGITLASSLIESLFSSEGTDTLSVIADASCQKTLREKMSQVRTLHKHVYLANWIGSTQWFMP